MENASKALLIAGGILIAMIVISVGVILINTYGELGSSYDLILSAQEVQKFNSRFLKFDGRKNITAQEIVSLVNYVRHYNKEFETDIKVNVTNSDEVDGNLVEETKDLMTFIKNNSTSEIGAGAEEEIKIIYFECMQFTDTNYDSEGKIKKIEFKKIV